jgi:hypothetical protein
MPEAGRASMSRGGCRRSSLRGKDVLPVASVASQLSSLAECASAISRLTRRWHLGARGPGIARTRPPSNGAQCYTNGGHHRLAVGQDHR